VRLAVPGAALKRPEGTADFTNFVGPIEERDGLVQFAVRERLNTVAQGQKFPDHLGMEHIESHREGDEHAQANDEPSNQDGTISFSGELVGPRVDSLLQFFGSDDELQTGVLKFGVRAGTHEPGCFFPVTCEGRGTDGTRIKKSPTKFIFDRGDSRSPRRGEADGVVLTHGTNTLEETAWLLHLTVATDAPIVLTGAMRPASALSADGPLNLVEAVRVAASSAARGLGVLVVMTDAIHGARDVTKSNTLRVDAFSSPMTGPIGRVDGDGLVVLATRPARAVTLRGAYASVDLQALPRVDVVASYQGADRVLIDAAVAAGARGIVSAATGDGYPTPTQVEALGRASAAGVAVVQSTRVGSGRVVPVPALLARGWIAADDLNPWKARILLRLALAAGEDLETIRARFVAP